LPILIALAGAVLPLFAGCSADEAQPKDQTPPGAVNDLEAVAIGTDTILLRWTAPGDDGQNGTAVSYDIRFSEAAIGDGGWEASQSVPGVAAPRAAGEPESLAVGSLLPRRLYYFGLKSVDEAGNVSPLSNSAGAKTQGLPDVIPPAPIGDLRAISAGDSSITLAWTAVGDDSLTGAAFEYDLRYSREPITDANWMSAWQAVGEPEPAAAGTGESFIVTDAARFFQGTPAYFAIKVVDEAGNWSATSNLVAAYIATTPERCLLDLGRCWEERRYPEYSNLLSEDFTYVFYERDVNDPLNPTPPQWPRVDELESARHLFESQQVDRITIGFSMGPAAPSPDEFPGTWKVEMTLIDLSIETHAADGSPLVLQVRGGRAVFYLKQFAPEADPNGEPIWRIFRWVDDGFGAGKSEFWSWGQIKARYR